ncbi:hypothetical protein LZC95_11250 [Pendulispora brunnea]|uniref:Uncharacterized protein n=1 Tax=Pendulispora brunnea TaxID=2905690 RepID=A0ABZ2KFR3_9BACT
MYAPASSRSHSPPLLEQLDGRSLAFLALSLFLLAGLLVHGVLRAAGAWFRRLRARTRASRAMAGEADAAEWLSELGYEILGTQIAAKYVVWIDREPFTVGLRADYLVQKKGARFVAEVKTGKLAPRIDTAATRRQLLEYRVAFDVDGVLLVDAEARRVQAVTFSMLE